MSNEMINFLSIIPIGIDDRITPINCDIAFINAFLDVTKRTSKSFYRLLKKNKNRLSLISTLITIKEIEEKQSFLQVFNICLHETYHLISQKKFKEKWKELPKQISETFDKLDKKNFDIVLELTRQGKSNEEIKLKIKELEKKDEEEYPEIFAIYNKIENKPDIFIVENIANKCFRLKTKKLIDFVDFDKVLPPVVKDTLYIYDSYVNPITKTNAFNSDLYSFLDEFIAAIQSVKIYIDFFYCSIELFDLNSDMEIIIFIKQKEEVIKKDLLNLVESSKRLIQYVYIICMYLSFLKNENVNMYESIIKDKKILTLFKNISKEIKGLPFNIQKILGEQKIDYCFSEKQSFFVDEILKNDELLETFNYLYFDIQTFKQINITWGKYQ